LNSSAAAPSAAPNDSTTLASSTTGPTSARAARSASAAPPAGSAGSPADVRAVAAFASMANPVVPPTSACALGTACTVSRMSATVARAAAVSASLLSTASIRAQSPEMTGLATPPGATPGTPATAAATVGAAGVRTYTSTGSAEPAAKCAASNSWPITDGLVVNASDCRSPVCIEVTRTQRTGARPRWSPISCAAGADGPRDPAPDPVVGHRVVVRVWGRTGARTARTTSGRR
jgi:hypothetical protein